MIELRQLTKRFGNLTAVNNANLTIQDGEIFGLLGPNGAGKTTLINMLCGLMKPSGGEITIGGHDLKKDSYRIKRMLGVIPQDLAIYEDLTAFENVEFFAGLYGLRGAELRSAVNDSLEFTGLSDAAKKIPKTFSGGMKRRLNIACGLAHRPDVIIMDEPTVGIDPQSRHHILEAVRKLNRKGCTVIYTTHYMEEAEMLCTRSAIIDHGKIIAEGTNEELQALIKANSRYVITMKGDHRIDGKGLEKIQGVVRTLTEGNKVYIDNDKGINNITEIIAWFSGREIPVQNIELDAPSLEMVFLTLTGRNLRD